MTLTSLNPDQDAIVAHGDGPALVIAGAGSGKTRVIIHRMVRLIQDGVDPRSILLLTFTKKAAEEMLARAGEILGYGSSTIFGGTFHHFCNRILRRYAEEAGLQPGYTILDAEDSREIISDCRKKIEAGGTSRLELPRPQVIHKVISMAVNHHLGISDTLRKHETTLIHLDDAIERIRDQYVLRKREMNAVDFDDLLSLVHRLLHHEPGVDQEVAGMFRYVMVDEYQDTNRLQAEIALRLSRHHHNLMVVGDDMQSIYAFRGAHFKNIMEFPDLLDEVKVYKLRCNYRSTPEILTFANGIIAGAREGFRKELESVSTSGELPDVIQLPDDVQQSTYVAEEVLKAIDSGIPPAEIAVLYRAHSHSLRLQTELMRRDIPFALRSGLKFFELAHIKDLLAFLRVGVNPRDAVSIGRLLRLVPGVGKKTAESIAQRLMEGKTGDAVLTGIRVKADSKTVLNLLLSQLLEVRADAEPVNAIGGFIEKFYADRLPLIYENYEERMSDVHAFADISSGYETIEILLDELSLLAEHEEAAKGTEKSDCVVLSSVHQAKGLEWHSVFLLSCQDGAFPTMRSFEDPSRLEEERRLFYVAVTRAKRVLTICYPVLITGWRSHWSRLSRFVEDVPEHGFKFKPVRLKSNNAW